MKKFLSIILLAAAYVAPTALAQSSALPDLGGETVTIAVENAYKPFNFVDEDTGEPIGWDYDVVNELCARLNCVPEFIETSWDGMILAVSNGEFDLAADGITITEERDELVDFSVGYVALNQVILGRVGEERFTDAASFAADSSLIIGTQPGTTNYIVAEELFGADRIVAYETFPISVQALLAGDVDAVILDDIAGIGYVGVNSEALQIYGAPLTNSEELGFIFENGSTLTRAFNQALVDMRLDGSLQVINTTWFADTAE
jgi:polar amino acid transport system substrate-binding protein